MANSWLSSAWSTVSAYVPGLTGGANTQLEPPPKVVLVPPFFQRDVRGLSRFCRSSYDYLGSRKQLSRLLRDHLQPEVRGGLLLSPPDDQRVSVRARLRHGGGSMVLRWQPTGAADLHTFLELAAALDSPGHVLCRAAYLHPASGLGAFAVAPLLAGAGGGGGGGSGGAGGGGGGAVATSAPQVGVRYSSESLAAGAIVSAGGGGGGGGAELERAWLAARTPHGLTLGVELRPAAPLHQLAAAAAEGMAALSGAAATAAAAPPSTSPAPAAKTTPTATATAATSPPAAAAAAPAAATAAPGSSAPPPLPPLAHLGGWLRSRSSVLLAYSPPPHAAAARGQQQAAAGSPGSSFTAAVEVADGQRVTFSFFQHVAATRQVVNPFEENEVVGITNYLDLGLQLTTAVPSGPTAAAAAPGAAPPTKQQQPAGSSSSSGGGGGGGATAAASSVDLAASWQINKNWIVKARVGSESAAAAIGVRRNVDADTAAAVAAAARGGELEAERRRVAALM
ncbi:hypothetical protein CHLRE_08g358552v5 [Chlamydomonas reinhardtii]|uniref:Uncharacterized protein n=1 Tax=Chlamydomonas reinhardtii TaxID=3055 RepID=A0A2K3DG91_CHLRE|nr:uncharacterized protein CHLRE_08g358552v5 [Chlamydomonas reinhardtii]PNW79542.1 hypothetical protein CHLRE_08g358552v5 [Chlamydomonas reinhardtii]